MSKLINADWTDERLAQENNKINEEYFKKGIHKDYPAYFKLKEAVEWILQRDNKRPLKFLDYGCGTAWYGVYLKDEGLFEHIEYNGADLSKSMCDKAKTNLPQSNFIVADASEEHFDKEYDVVTEMAVLELVPKWEEAMKNILKSSGKWCVFHRMYFKSHGEETVKEQVNTYLKIPDIRIHISLDDFDYILSKNNFDLVRADRWEKNNLYKQGTFIARRKDA